MVTVIYLTPNDYSDWKGKLNFLALILSKFVVDFLEDLGNRYIVLQFIS